MDERARGNLAAAGYLLGGEVSFACASVNRSYYAVYHAAWHALESDGHQVPRSESGKRYFPHDSLPGESVQAGLLDFDQQEQLELLRARRVVADYRTDEITTGHAEHSRRLAQALVMVLLSSS